MRFIKYIFILFYIMVFSQEKIQTTLLEKQPLKVDVISGTDQSGTIIYIKDNTLIKENTELIYNNIQLGDITSVDLFNPLKINLFYSGFNTAIILDNRLAEISNINFNALQPIRTISHISTGNDNTIWIFNQDLQQLELFDYKTNTNRSTTLPVEGQVMDLTSDYNFSWLLTDSYLYCFNYFGSLVSKRKNDGYSKLKMYNQNLLLLKENAMYLWNEESNKTTRIDLPELLINQFFVKNETLYIYSGEHLYRYQLKNL